MSLKPKTKIKRTPEKAIKKIKLLAKAINKKGRVKVGLPSDTGAYPDGTSTVMVGAVHEFGSPSRNIPQRSFLRATVVENRLAYKALMAKLAKDIIDGKIDSKKALEILGLTMSTDVKSKITEINDPPLQSREGNALVDTGHLRRAITYEVNE